MDLPTILLILAAMSIGATVIAVLVALRAAREARTAIFPIVKEEESNRARRARVSILVWIAVTAILIGGWLASLRLTTIDDSSVAPDAESGQPAETGVVEFATPSLSDAQPTPDAAVPPATASDASEPSPATPTAIASPTPAPAASNSTPTPTESPPPLPPPASRGPAPANAQLGSIEFATEVGTPIQAVNPGTVFPGGSKIYAVYPYSGMQNGITFSAVWYLDQVEIVRDEQPWEWGVKGRSYSFLLPPGEGSYKLELYVNDSLLTSGSFEVR